MTNRGFSLVEFLLAIVIATVVGFVVTLFAKNVISFGSSAQANMTAILESRKILSTMVAELRSISPSALGAYPIESVATSSIVFFTDVNSDNVSDRVRYFLDPATRSVKRGVTLATGEPPGYTVAEEITIIATDVINGPAAPLFDYHTGNYAGTSSPMVLPGDISTIRLVKINMIIDRDPNRPPEPMTLSSQAAMRNLKDNL